ncbi:MAG: glutamate-5-semialdehyde dehydrogenase [Kiritimatiellae bacterium]|nr:glutamate-5-semialdehyde dehydrogenase [Kiritimatiellia bacterium]MDD4734853.1 glutamate-5-semialdehyde dehydrogenase [Kiritimatiellia bacterium]
MNLHEEMIQMGDQALKASRELALLSSRKKNAILEAMADELEANRAAIQQANQKDMEAGRKAGLNDALLDRLELTDKRLDGMIKGILNVTALEDPVGKDISRWIRPNGIEIRKTRVPIGVIGIIYESRPNVTADATVLCIKTSNAVILRGGKEAIHSNQILARLLQLGGAKKGLPDYAIQLIQTTDREAVKELCQLEGRVDLIIPRGGEGLIRAVTDHARVPVIKHYKGVCHVYVDEHADPDMAERIIENAKCQRPGVCNAIETLLIHEAIAPTFVPRIVDFLERKGVKLKGDEAVRRMILQPMEHATEADWETEYLDLVLSLSVVPEIHAAIEHINRYGSHHSDAIVSENEAAQKTFVKEVDSATVYINASTRFTDGSEFGMGAEIGISTDKLHARGPMGLEELTTYKYIITGEGQIRE